MPELPEVETIRRGLAAHLVGHKIIAVDVRAPKLFIGTPEAIIGQKVLEIERRAKILIWKLDHYFLLTHLKMTGQLIFVPKKQTANSFQLSANRQQPTITARLRADSRKLKAQSWVIGGHPDKSYDLDLPHKHTHIIITFDNGMLYYNDLRKFGWIKIVASLEGLKKEVGHFGPEYTWPEFSFDYFQTELARRRTTLKQTLLDQTVVAGIGNIYADESLFCARINPLKKSDELNETETKKLFDCIPKVFNLALKHGGTSSRDYRQADGSLGTYLKVANVYRREGQPCHVCGQPIERIKIAGRSCHYCQKCQ